MGLMNSKMSNEASNSADTKWSRTLSVDPRSISDEIVRTPIEVQQTPNKAELIIKRRKTEFDSEKNPAPSKRRPPPLTSIENENYLTTSETSALPDDSKNLKPNDSSKLMEFEERETTVSVKGNLDATKDSETKKSEIST